MRLGTIFYNGFELLDAYGPLEMFGALGDKIELVTIAEQAGPVKSSPGPKTLADYGFDDAPELDMILVPGGIGTIPELENDALIRFLQERCPKSQVTRRLHRLGVVGQGGLARRHASHLEQDVF